MTEERKSEIYIGNRHRIRWLITHKRRCEQQSYFSVNPRDQLMPENININKTFVQETSS